MIRPSGDRWRGPWVHGLWLGTDDTGSRRVSPDTLTVRLNDSGIATRYYTPEVHLASFALPRFILEIVERAHSG